MSGPPFVPDPLSYRWLDGPFIPAGPQSLELRPLTDLTAWNERFCTRDKWPATPTDKDITTGCLIHYWHYQKLRRRKRKWFPFDEVYKPPLFPWPPIG